jgi:hypothetical protein
MVRPLLLNVKRRRVAEPMKLLLMLIVVLQICSGDIRGDGRSKLRIPSPAPVFLESVLETQDRHRKGGELSALNRERLLLSDDDHVLSSAPTENTNAPTPSGSSGVASTCMATCSGYNPSTWNLDNWCSFYWDAGCYLPDTNYLNIAPAGKAEVSSYACVPVCLQSSACGPAYCKTFAHLSASCRTGYARLSFNATLQVRVLPRLTA